MAKKTPWVLKAHGVERLRIDVNQPMGAPLAGIMDIIIGFWGIGFWGIGFWGIGFWGVFCKFMSAYFLFRCYRDDTLVKSSLSIKIYS